MNIIPFFPKQETTLHQNNVRLEPLTLHHTEGLQAASQDGEM